jgi:hypothetical protein
MSRHENDPDPRLDEAVRDLPRSIEPDRDLWPGIEREIRAGAREVPPDRAGEKTGAGASAGSPGRGRPGTVIEGRFDGWRRALLAAAAVAIFLIGYLIGDRASREPLPPGPEPRSDRAAAPAGALDTLLAAFDRQDSSLDPEVVEVLRRNLELIEAAMREIRAALEEDPGNPRLERMLDGETRRRGVILRRAADLAEPI